MKRHVSLLLIATTSLLAAQAGIVVPENEMKWQIIHPEPDRYDFTRADALLSFATQHDQKLRGHNLCWHNQLPAWFAKLATPANAADLLRRHIAQVAGHFAGHVRRDPRPAQVDGRLLRGWRCGRQVHALPQVGCHDGRRPAGLLAGRLFPQRVQRLEGVLGGLAAPLPGSNAGGRRSDNHRKE